jgi:hypothetical protein
MLSVANHEVQVARVAVPVEHGHPVVARRGAVDHLVDQPVLLVHPVQRQPEEVLDARLCIAFTTLPIPSRRARTRAGEAFAGL